MKTLAVLTGLLMVLTINTQAMPMPPISVISITVTNEANADGSNVTVVAYIGIQPVTNGGQAMLSIMSTNGLVGQVFPPEILTFVHFHLKDGLPKESIEHGYCFWTNTSWNPYFTGDFVVTVAAMDLKNGSNAVNSTTVTVARTISGTMNSVQVPVDTNAAYDANGTFTNIDLTKVFLHNIGGVTTEGGFMIPCNLANNPTNVTITNGMTAEQIDMAYMDTATNYPAGTPFRFDMNLHVRPTSMMGFGEIKRFVWTPDVATNPAGRGNLKADVVSCQPRRQYYATNFQAHVGCAPLFMTDTNVATEMEGMIMSATAHYMDVVPDTSAIGSQWGIGLKVNGHSNTTSYLKAFIPDAMLARMGVPVARATKLLDGYVTHFNTNNVSEGDTTVVTTEFTRIAPIIAERPMYAYYSTNGDSGIEAQLAFTFHSPVTAQIGRSSVEGDFDGDRLADPYWPVKSNVLGMWTIWLSSVGYLPWGPYVMSVPDGEPVHVADFDGDGKADIVMVAGENWYVWLSKSGYQPPQGPSFIIPVLDRVPVAGDFDGDRKADAAMMDKANGNWTVWLSSLGYQPPEGLCLPLSSVPGHHVTPLAGDFDGDRKSDPVMVSDGNWYFYMSSGGYVQSGPYYISVPGADVVPMIGDFDGDGLADMAAVVNNNWTFWFSSEGYGHSWGPYPFVP